MQAFAIERGGDVGRAGNGGKNFAVARQRRYRILYAGGEARQCELDRSPLKRRNRLPTNKKGDKATPRLNAGGEPRRIALRNLRACSPRRRTGSRPNPTTEILCMGLFFEK